LVTIPYDTYQTTDFVIGVIDIGLLVQKLNGLPLALAQAGCFIGRTSITVQQYITFFDKMWAELMEDQDKFPLQDYAERSMLTTWRVSYEQVARKSEAAATLLRLWAFFYHDDLWYGLLAGVRIQDLTAAAKWHVELSKLARSEFEFSKAMGLLTAYSLADSKAPGSYSMHSIPHRWSRLLSLPPETTSLQRTAALALAETIPFEKDANHGQLDRRLSNHVLNFLLELPDQQALSEETLPSETAQSIGQLLQRQEYFDKAERMFDWALAGELKTRGHGNTGKLFSIYSDQAILCWQLKRLDNAEEMYKRSIAFTSASEPDGLWTLAAMGGLALVYKDQEKPKEAELMYKRCLAGYEKKEGRIGLNTLITCSNLGSLLMDERRLEEAVPLIHRALAGFEKIYGKTSLNETVLHAVEITGFLYHHQGKLSESVHMFERALASSQAMYGRSHPRTAGAAKWVRHVRSLIGM
jgi:tetratricopeptide (TPR) repeat protein